MTNKKASPETSDKRKAFEQKLRDLEVPGTVVEFEPEEAEEMGAFEETALSEEDALEGAFIPDEHWETENGYEPKDPL